MPSTATHSADTPEPAAALPPVEGDAPAIILSADKTIYRDGEIVTARYGASEPGWMHLYTWIDGQLTNVAGKAVQSGQFYTMSATATVPHGEQTLVALWQEGEVVSAVTLATLKENLATPRTAEGASGERALVLSVESPLIYKTLSLVLNP